MYIYIYIYIYILPVGYLPPNFRENCAKGGGLLGKGCSVLGKGCSVLGKGGSVLGKLAVYWENWQCTGKTAPKVAVYFGTLGKDGSLRETSAETARKKYKNTY